MTAPPALDPSAAAALAASTQRTLRLHALWKALEAVPLPRLAAWVELAWLSTVFRGEPWLGSRARRRLLAARIAAPDEVEPWIARGPTFYLEMLPEELALARARLGGLRPLRAVREALQALLPYTGVSPALARIRRPPARAPLLLAVEDLEVGLVGAGVEPAACALTAFRLCALGRPQDAGRWLDAAGAGVASWAWVWAGDPTGLADQVRADLAAAEARLPPGEVAALQGALGRVLRVAGLPPEETGAARHAARRAAVEALAEALRAAGRRARHREVVLFLAALDGRLDEEARRLGLPRALRGPDGLGWVRRAEARRLRRRLAPVARLPGVAEALARWEELP